MPSAGLGNKRGRRLRPSVVTIARDRAHPVPWHSGGSGHSASTASAGIDGHGRRAAWRDDFVTNGSVANAGVGTILSACVGDFRE
ncbi:MAG: hypothetical protein AB7V26_02565 [Lysobacterales bacterium]